jgi:hypothetical protein
VWAVDVVASVAVIHSTTQSVPTAYRACARPLVVRELRLGRIRSLCRPAGGSSVESLAGGVPRDSSGSAFAAAMGARPALRDVRSRLDLTSSDEDRMSDPLADAWRQAGG